MKTKRMITAVLSAAMVLSAVPVMAETDAVDTVVYSYTDENGTQVDITQAELDAGFWNTETLGDVAPDIYEDFPAKISSYANEFTDLTIYVDYLKSLDGENSATLEVTNIFTDEVVYTDDLTDGGAMLNNAVMNTHYKFTISETIDGEETEYNKAVMTSLKEAEMPEYVTADSTESETIVLVGNIEDLRASLKTDENGDQYYDTDMPRYTQVKACDFNDYVAELDHSNIYRVYTSDGSGYSGFIMDNSGTIWNPSITVVTWDEYCNPAPSVTADDVDVSASAILSASSSITFWGYRDACFKHTDGSTPASQIVVGAYVLPERENGDGGTEDSNIIFSAESNRSDLTWQIWYSTPSTSNNGIYSGYGTPQRLKSARTSDSGTINFSFLRSAYPNANLNAGTKLYFVVNFPSNTSAKIYMSCRSADWNIDSDDANKTGSDISFNFMRNAYESSLSQATLTETLYTIKNPDDVDAFYVNDEGETRSYKLYVENRYEGSDVYIKDVELVRVRKTGDWVYTDLIDVVEPATVTSGSSKKGLSFSTSSSKHYGVYVYSARRNMKATNDPYYISFDYE